MPVRDGRAATRPAVLGALLGRGRPEGLADEFSLEFRGRFANSVVVISQYGFLAARIRLLRLRPAPTAVFFFILWLFYHGGKSKSTAIMPLETPPRIFLTQRRQGAKPQRKRRESENPYAWGSPTFAPFFSALCAFASLRDIFPRRRPLLARGPQVGKVRLGVGLGPEADLSRHP